MTLETEKEMDRQCVMNWLIEVYRNPTVAFNTHSDEQQIEFAHDALVLLKEQEKKKTMVVESTNVCTGLPIAHCPKCGVSLDKYLYGRRYEGEINYCPFCGQAIKWE